LRELHLQVMKRGAADGADVALSAFAPRLQSPCRADKLRLSPSGPLL